MANVWDGENAAIGQDCGGLMCPICGSEQLHQYAVKVIAHEEDSRGMVITVSGLESSLPDVHIDSSPEQEEYAGRRSHIDVYFWCEGCGGRVPLVLRCGQHKGTTHLQWHKPTDGQALRIALGVR